MPASSFLPEPEPELCPAADPFGCEADMLCFEACEPPAPPPPPPNQASDEMVDLVQQMRQQVVQPKLELRKADETDRASLGRLLTSINDIKEGANNDKKASANKNSETIKGLLSSPGPSAGFREEAPRKKLESTPAASGWTADSTGPDEVQVSLLKMRQARTGRDWELALQSLIEALVRRGFPLNQLTALQHLLQRVQAQPGGTNLTQTGNWLQQVQKWVNELLNTPGSVRQDNFWM